MKTTLIIEIETPDNYDVWEDGEKSKEDYTAEELKEFSDEFSKGFHDEIVEYIKNNTYDNLNDTFADGDILEEYQLESWDSLKDYEVKINIENGR